MAVMQRQFSVDETKLNQKPDRCFYTSDTDMNDMLNRFVKEAEISGFPWKPVI